MQQGLRFDRGAVTKAVTTDEGYLRADAIVTRTGVFEYMNADGTIRKELRHPDDVHKADSLASLKLRPITNGHPTQRIVNADNAKELQVGFTNEQVKIDQQFIITGIMITDSKSIQDIKSGKRQELSLGYNVDLKEEKGIYQGEAYTHRQTNIRYNHLAIVDRARAGKEARIHLDASDSEEIESVKNNYFQIDELKANNEKAKGLKKMTDEKLVNITLDGIDYKASPEVVNEFKKSKASIVELQAKLDSANVTLEKAKAEKDDLKTKLDEANKIDFAAKVSEAVTKRVALIGNVKTIMGKKAEDIKTDSMSDLDIMKAVVMEKCPTVKVDEASEVYIQARFDMLCEAASTETSDEFAKQREKAGNKMDGTSANDAAAAFKRMQEETRNRWKKPEAKA